MAKTVSESQKMKNIYLLLDKLFFDWIANNFFVGMTLFKDGVFMEDVIPKNPRIAPQEIGNKTTLFSEVNSLGRPLSGSDTIGQVFAIGEKNPLIKTKVPVNDGDERDHCILQGKWFEWQWNQFGTRACLIATESLVEGDSNQGGQPSEDLSKYKDGICAKYKETPIDEALDIGDVVAEGRPRWGERDALVLDKFKEAVSVAMKDFRGQEGAQGSDAYERCGEPKLSKNARSAEA